MDQVFLIEAWCIDLDGESTVGVHLTLEGAFKRAGVLASESWDEYEEAEEDSSISLLGWTLTYDQNEQDQTYWKITTPRGEVIETWTIIPTKVEE